MRTIKKILPFLFLALFTLSASGQQSGNLEFFSKNGEKFYIILNGQQMHESPETNVKLKGLKAERYKVKVIFKDSSIGTLDKNVIVKPGRKFTYVIRKNVFDNYAVKPYSKAKLASKDGGDQSGSQGGKSGTSGGDAKKKGQGGQGAKKGVPTKTGQGVSISVNINASDGSFNTSIQTRTTTTTTKTTTRSTGTKASGKVEKEGGHEHHHHSEGEGKGEDPLPEYDGKTGCEDPMSDSRFREAKSSIKKKNFADAKMTQAKRMTKSNCLLTDQVKEIVELFDFEDDRVEFAKFAYEHTYDQDNYYKIHDSFEFSSSIDELDKHIEGK
ncbi:MAG: DUF4476 domain-containing protein [Flavobacteriales bacterium]